MAVSIVASLSKKMPIANQEYAMQQVGVTITGEVSDLTRVPEESARLLALAEAAVDSKLSSPSIGVTSSHARVSSSPNSSTQAPSSLSKATYRSSGVGRPAPAAISAAQVRFLRKLLDRTPGAQDRILAEHRIQAIEALTSRAASAVIDQLKGPAP